MKNRGWFNKVWRQKNKRKYPYNSIVEEAATYSLFLALLIHHAYWGFLTTVAFALFYGFCIVLVKGLICNAIGSKT